MGIQIILGAQWGDEGKGKWVDALAAQADIVVRYQGGNNAGHTLYPQGKKVVLHLLPSGVVQQKICALTSQMVIDPVSLQKEIGEMPDFIRVNPDNLWISERAHVISPWHIERDKKSESKKSTPIGTTGRGIGPAYEDKAARTGLTVGAFIDDKLFSAWLAQKQEIDAGFNSFIEENKKAWDSWLATRSWFAKFVAPAEQRIREAVLAGKKILIEGAQGALLDLDHGTYPFVTASSTTAGGALSSIGLPAKNIEQVLGVAKAYVTRVGGGPFPTEITDELGEEIRKRGQEYGATTGRPRRCGWFDAVAMRYVASINGLDGILLNKLDILSGLAELKICTAYQHPTLGTLSHFPGTLSVLAECTPVYQSFPGWDKDISEMRSFSALPQNAQTFVRAIEEFSQVAVAKIGVGPERDAWIKPS